jgi:hypothetical protein
MDKQCTSGIFHCAEENNENMDPRWQASRRVKRSGASGFYSR